MDPIGAAASIAGLLEFIYQVIKLIEDVRGSDDERNAVVLELSSMGSLLKWLREREKESQVDDSLMSIRDTTGPLTQLEAILDALSKKFKTSGKLRKVVSAVKWHFEKESIAELLERVHRLQNIFIAALANDEITLLKLLQSNMEQVKATLDEVKDAQALHRHQTQEHHASFESWKLDDRLAKMLAWLNAPDPSINYFAGIAKRQEHTGQWLVTSPTFTQWKLNAGHLIWISGKPGCGKSILTSTIIENTMQYHHSVKDSAMGYFFFDCQDQPKRDWRKMLASLVLQIASSSNEYSDSLSSLYAQHGNGIEQPSARVLSSVLKDLMNEFKHAFIIIDALDECTSLSNLLDWINDVFSSATIRTRLHMLVLSRRSKEIEDELKHLINPRRDGRHIGMDDKIVDADINLFVSAQLQTDKKLRKFENVHSKIRNAVDQKANGMFRWAYCQLDALRGCLTDEDVEKALETLPETLDDTYARILRDIEGGRHAQRALKILSWLCYSQRPLRLDEVIDILAIRPNEARKFDTKRRILEHRDILAICPSLITIVRRKEEWYEWRDKYEDLASNDIDTEPRQALFDESQHRDNETEQPQVQELRLAHFSVKEYLVSSRNLGTFAMNEGLVNESIALDCLCYLSQFKVDVKRPTKGHRKWVYEQRPAAQYCATYWYHHARKAETEGYFDRIEPLAYRQITDPPLFNNAIWLESDDRGYEYRLTLNTSNCLHIGLVYVAHKGLFRLTNKLLVEGANANVNLSTDIPDMTTILGYHRVFALGTPLHAACHAGDQTVLQLLLQHGADIHAEGHAYHSALCGAAAAGHYKIVKTLFEHGARDGPRRDRDHRKGPRFHLTAVEVALLEAPLSLRHKVVSTLLRHHSIYVSSLPYVVAYMSDAVHMTKILLSSGALVDAHNEDGVSLLHLAAKFNNVRLCQLLLDHHANIDLRDKDGRTPLMYASDEGRISVVTLLLDHGANINAEDIGGRNALMYACKHEAEDVVALLIQHRVSVNNTDRQGRTALHYANAGIVEFLLQRGAGIEARDHAGRTPIFYDTTLGIWGERAKIIELIRLGANVSATDRKGWTVLHFLSSKVSSTLNSDLFAHLLFHGLDPNAQDAEGDSALSLASASGNSRVVELLLNSHADFRSRNNRGLNALQQTMENTEDAEDAWFRERQIESADILRRSGAVDFPMSQRRRSWPFSAPSVTVAEEKLEMEAIQMKNLGELDTESHFRSNVSSWLLSSQTGDRPLVRRSSERDLSSWAWEL